MFEERLGLTESSGNIERKIDDLESQLRHKSTELLAGLQVTERQKTSNRPSEPLYNVLRRVSIKPSDQHTATRKRGNNSQISLRKCPIMQKLVF